MGIIGCLLDYDTDEMNKFAGKKTEFEKNSTLLKLLFNENTLENLLQ